MIPLHKARRSHDLDVERSMATDRSKKIEKKAVAPNTRWDGKAQKRLVKEKEMHYGERRK